MDTQTLQQRVEAIPYWYHKIELPGGIVTPGWSPIDAARYCIPDDLTGKRVLDIGTWDGYWTWEALRRGAAEVVAIEDFSDDCGKGIKRNGWETFDLCREAFGFTLCGTTPGCWIQPLTGQIVRRLEMSVYDLDVNKVNGVNEVDDTGRFDVVFFFGTIYHLKHPLLALEKIAAACDGSIYLESAICDDYSPYRGGLGKGYAENDMVMEFYPGDQYAQNTSNWWVPTVECLCSMLMAVGFGDVSGWALTDQPQSLPECRGFASGTKDAARCPAGRPAEIAPVVVGVRPPKIMAVMSVPRLGFQDNAMCCYLALARVGVPLEKVQGAYWGACLERGIDMAIDEGADWLLTIDYDTLFNYADFRGLCQLLAAHPEATAVVPLQSGRGTLPVLVNLRTRSGRWAESVPVSAFAPPTTRILTGHFGCTLFRVEDMLKVPRPWFQGVPNQEGRWDAGRTDDDMYFWLQMEKAGKTVLSANRVVIGHLELMAKWPGRDLKPIYARPDEFFKTGKPAQCWQ